MTRIGNGKEINYIPLMRLSVAAQARSNVSNMTSFLRNTRALLGEPGARTPNVAFPCGKDLTVAFHLGNVMYVPFLFESSLLLEICLLESLLPIFSPLRLTYEGDRSVVCVVLPAAGRPCALTIVFSLRCAQTPHSIHQKACCDAPRKSCGHATPAPVHSRLAHTTIKVAQRRAAWLHGGGHHWMELAWDRWRVIRRSLPTLGCRCLSGRAFDDHPTEENVGRTHKFK